MIKKKIISFSDVGTFFEGLPIELAGGLTLALFSMWKKKYGNEEFELDFDLISDAVYEIIAYIDQGKSYNDIIKWLMKRDRYYADAWRQIDDLIIQYVPIDKRDELVTILSGKMKMTFQADEDISVITRKKRHSIRKINSDKDRQTEIEITSFELNNENKLPQLEINLNTGIVRVNGVIIKISPVEFSHYCVLAKNVSLGNDPYRMDESDIPQEMVIGAFEYYENAFHNLVDTMTQSEIDAKKNNPIEVKTWRSYISKINSAFIKSKLDPLIIKHYQVNIDGKRNSKLYSIKTSPKNIKFVK